MRYVEACLVEDLQGMTYRFYVTDALKAIVGAKVRYADMVFPDGNNTLKEERSPKEVIDDIKSKLGAMGKDKVVAEV